jgi:hypothetical protein
VSPGISEDPFALKQRDERGGPCFFVDSQALIATNDNATTNGAPERHHAQWRFRGSCWSLNVSPYTKDRFTVDLEHGTVTCPNAVTVGIGRLRDGGGVAKFAEHCTTCPLRSECTTSSAGRKIRVGVHEAALARARQEQTDPTWREDYRATRPKVERKLAHLMRRRHGGRRARVRGQIRVGADFSLLSAAANLARLATLGVRSVPDGGWSVA